MVRVWSLTDGRDLALVSRFPIYDLMRDYLTLSWARFSKDVQSHTLQISKILSHPAPRPGELVRLDASSAPTHGGAETSLEVVARFPGGLDFGRGLVDVNFTMWPLFKCLNIDNILTICEVNPSLLFFPFLHLPAPSWRDPQNGVVCGMLTAVMVLPRLF